MPLKRLFQISGATVGHEEANGANSVETNATQHSPAISFQTLIAESVQSTGKDFTACDEVEKYFHELPSLQNAESDPLNEFWKLNSSRYPCLTLIAYAILSIPATSAPVERIFSNARHLCANLRTRLSDEMLETELLLSNNSHLL